MLGGETLSGDTIQKLRQRLVDNDLVIVQIGGMAVILAGIALVTGYWQPLPPSRPPERNANA